MATDAGAVNLILEQSWKIVKWWQNKPVVA